MLYYIISTLAMLVVALTMLARANDLRWQKGVIWQVRLVGFAAAGFTAMCIPVVELYYREFPNFLETVFRVGLMCVFVTTPYLPPWWRWISGKDHE